SLAWMLGRGDPPPGDRIARDELPGVSLLLGSLVDADVDHLELAARRLQPEIDVVGLGLLALHVEVDIREVAVALDAAHEAHLLELQLEVDIRLWVLVAEGAVLALGLDVGLDDRARVLLREFLVRPGIARELQ